MKYVLQKGPDNITWCSLEPLMQDVNESLEKLVKIDLTPLSDTDKDIMDFNILGMKAIYTFLGALVQEANIKQQNEENKCAD